MKSIYFKNFTATAAMVVLSFFILGLAFVFLGRSYVINNYRNGMQANAEEVRHNAQAMVHDGSLTDWGLRMTISSLSQITGNHIFLCDTNGTVVSCSDMNIACVHIGQQIGGTELVTLARGEMVDEVSTLGAFYPTPHYVVAEPIDSADGTQLGYVFVTADSGTIVASWDTFLWVFLAASAAVMTLALLLAFMTSKRMAKPLDEMARAARSFAHGDFSVRVEEEDRDDEVGALVSAFNTMADSLERSEQRRNDFIANVSHELKTPMTTIAGFADGLLDGTIPKDQQDKYLATIADETRRLSRLVRSMLDLSRMESAGTDLTRRREFDILEVIISTLLSFEARAEEKRLDVDLQLPENHVNVLADPDAITRVVYNLMDNAVKFAACSPSPSGRRTARRTSPSRTAAKRSRRTICRSSSTVSTSPTAPAVSTATASASVSISSSAFSMRTARTSPSPAGTASPSSSSRSRSPRRGRSSARRKSSKSGN